MSRPPRPPRPPRRRAAWALLWTLLAVLSPGFAPRHVPADARGGPGCAEASCGCDTHGADEPCCCGPAAALAGPTGTPVIHGPAGCGGAPDDPLGVAARPALLVRTGDVGLPPPMRGAAPAPGDAMPDSWCAGPRPPPPRT